MLAKLARVELVRYKYGVVQNDERPTVLVAVAVAAAVAAAVAIKKKRQRWDITVYSRRWGELEMKNWGQEASKRRRRYKIWRRRKPGRRKREDGKQTGQD